MSLLIKVRGANFSALNLPKLEQTVLGFPADNLKGLYLLEDGTKDTVYDGAFVDSSGNGNHAFVRNTWTPPLKRASGIETNSENGMIIETPIPGNTSFSWVMVGKHNMEINPVETPTWRFPTFAGQTDDLSYNMESDSKNEKGLFINTDLQHTTVSSRSNWGTYSGISTMSRVLIPETEAEHLSVFGVTFNVTTGTVTLFDSSGRETSRTDALVGATMKTLTGNVAFGCWKHKSGVPVAGEMHLFAHYDRPLSRESMMKAMQAAKERVESRGVLVV